MRRFVTSILILSLFLFAPSKVTAKSYEIKNSSITIDVMADGSGEVLEEYDFLFDGQFSFIERWIQKGTNCKECEPYQIVFGSHWSRVKGDMDGVIGSYKLTEDPGKITLYTNLPDGVKNFTYKLSYKVNDLVTLHPEIAEMHWNVIGSEWEVSHQNVEVRINLPQSYEAGDIDLYINGVKKEVSGGKSINVSSLSTLPLSPLVIRLVFPNSGISSSRVGNLTRASISQEEGALVSKNIELKDLYMPIALSFLPLLWLLYLFVTWKRVGDDEPTPSVNLANSLHEPPSKLHPALVDALTNPFGVCRPQSITASIIRLIDMKVIDIVSENKEKVFGFGERKVYRLIASKNYSTTKLEKRDNDLLNFLFESRGVSEISFDEIKTAKKIPESMAKQFWKNWRSATGELVELGYLERKGALFSGAMTKIGYISLIVLIVIIQIGMFNFADSVLYIIPFATFFISALLTLLFSSFFNKRTTFGNYEYAKWLAFKKHLLDYSVTKKHPIASVVLWGEYLVYGAALGVSMKALSQLPVSFAKNTTGALVLARSNTNSGSSLSDILSNINSIRDGGLGRSAYGGSMRAGGGGGGRAG